MLIEATPLREISFEYNAEKIENTPIDTFKIERSFNYKANIKDDKVLFRLTYYLIFTDTRFGDQTLHMISELDFSTTPNGWDYYQDIAYLSVILESILDANWKSVQKKECYLSQYHLKHPYLRSGLLEEMMIPLKENRFYG